MQANGARTRRGIAAAGSWFAFVLLGMVLVSCEDGRTANSPGTAAPATTVASTVLKITGAGGSFPVTVELAARENERERGLMFRDSLPEDRGMLFLFATDQSGGFWMKNTSIPLTIAYLDSSGHVLELHDGRPFDETSLLPRQPYRYALELNQGWFQRHGLGVGAVVELPQNLPAAK